jgi:hypothetical protein
MPNSAEHRPRPPAVAFLVVVAWAVASLSPIPLRAQDDQERRLWDSEFLKKRQPAKTPASPAPQQAPVYKRVTPKSTDDSAPGGVIGITIWRLREPGPADTQDSRLLLQEEDDRNRTEWTPERVESETTFAEGDRVRLTVESPRAGFLYVVDREQYADGTTSSPYLIFPTRRIRGGANAVNPGGVVELPEASAFRLKPMRPDYTGELLTLLVTPEPLAGIAAGPGIQKLDAATVEQWERQWSATTERFELVGGAGKTYTKTEKEAGSGARLLTQEDELPQTLFRVVAKSDGPMLVSVQLRVKR